MSAQTVESEKPMFPSSAFNNNLLCCVNYNYVVNCQNAYKFIVYYYPVAKATTAALNC